MSQRSKNISERIKSFANEVIAFVESFTDSGWTRVYDMEKWSVGVTLEPGILQYQKWPQ